MSETVVRLKPTPDTLRRLFLLSGNFCAFPGCAHLVMNADGVFVAQLCHIEAAEKGGQRFNKNSNNEKRRAFENLMFMCHQHHKVTDNVSKYKVADLKKMKADHENRFSHPDRAILEGLTDWTSAEQSIGVENLGHMNIVLNYGHSEDELNPLVEELNEHIAELKNVPVEVRKFIGVVAERYVKMKKTGVTSSGFFSSHEILLKDLSGALRLSEYKVKGLAVQMENYNMGGLTESDTDRGMVDAVRLTTLSSGWTFWHDLAQFCKIEGESMEKFSVNLNFGSLDS